MKAFLAELKRRKVVRVTGVYLIAAWAVIEVADVVVEPLRLPEWTLGLVIVLCAAGLPLAVVLAWAFDLTPDGVRRTDGPPGGGAPGWRTAGLAGIGALVLWGGVVGGRVLVGDRPDPVRGSALSEGTSSLIAVLPFAVRGGTDLSYLGEGMVDLLSTALDGAGDVAAVDPFALLASVRRGDGSAPSPEDGRTTARRLGATHYVVGSVFDAGGRLRLRASLYGSDGGLVATAETRAPDEPRLYAAVDELAKELLTAVGAGGGSGLRELASVTSASLPALKEYLEGVRVARTGEWDRAIEPFQRAVALDSTFALAWLRLGTAASWTFADSLARHGLDRAVRLGRDLPDRERRLVAATHAFVDGDSREAARLYRRILTSRPEDLEATHMLGEIQWHFNPFHGLPMADSRETFERLLELDPANHEALIHLRHDAIFEGRVEAYDSLGLLHLERFPGSYEAPVTRAERAFLLGSEEDRRRSLRELEKLEDPLVALAALAAGMVTVDPLAVRRLAGPLTDPGRGVGTRAGGHVLAAYLDTGRGMLRGADRELRAAGVLDPATALEHRAFLAALPSLGPADAEVEAVRAELERWDPGAEPPLPGATAFFWHQAIHPHLRLYLLGLLSARLGDEEGARRYAAELEGSDAPVEAGSLTRDLGGGVRAYAAWKAGRPDEALGYLEGARMEVSWPRMHFSPFHGRVLERHLRGIVLAELGRDDEAVGWLGAEMSNPYLFVSLAPSRLARGRLRERRGDPEGAARDYRRVVELLAGADPGARGALREAEGRLSALGQREGGVP